MFPLVQFPPGKNDVRAHCSSAAEKTLTPVNRPDAALWFFIHSKTCKNKSEDLDTAPAPACGRREQTRWEQPAAPHRSGLPRPAAPQAPTETPKTQREKRRERLSSRVSPVRAEKTNLTPGLDQDELIKYSSN